MSAFSLDSVLNFPSGSIPDYFSALNIGVHFADGVTNERIAGSFELQADWTYDGISTALRNGWFSGNRIDQSTDAGLDFALLTPRVLSISGRFPSVHFNLLPALLRMIVFANHSPRERYERLAKEVGEDYTDNTDPISFHQQVAQIQVDWKPADDAAILSGHSPTEFAIDRSPVLEVSNGRSFDATQTLDGEDVSIASSDGIELTGIIEDDYATMIDAECFLPLTNIDREWQGASDLFQPSTGEPVLVSAFEGAGTGLVELANVLTGGQADHATVRMNEP